MGKDLLIGACLLLAMAGCSSSAVDEGLVVIDVKAGHPDKELALQDFMEMEYVPLETTDEFVTQGDVLAVGEKYMVVKNWVNDGDIFLFDRQTGKGVRKWNRRGQGDEEYTYINGAVLDEDRGEVFVNCSPTRKVMVYDLSGTFKRSFSLPEGAEALAIYDYDAGSLMLYDMSVYYDEGKSRTKPYYHLVISKQDGALQRGIAIPFDIVRAPYVQKGDAVAVASVCPVVPWGKDWLLVETSSDTVYRYRPADDSLHPVLAKKPAADPEVLLTMGVMTERYWFVQTIEKEFDFATGRGFRLGGLVYDRQAGEVYEPTVRNADYEWQEVDLISHPLNRGGIAAFQVLPADQLVEACGSGRLQGRLQEVAATLGEESNPVVMLMKPV